MGSSGVAGLPLDLKTGLWVCTPTVTNGGAAVTHQRRTATPLVITKATLFDRIGVSVTATTAGAGSVARLGVYSDADGFPGAVLLDAGTIALDDGTGNKSATISQTLNPGLYWLACQPEITSGGASMTTLSNAVGVFGFSYVQATGGYVPSFFEASQSGAFDAWGGATTSIDTGPPAVMLRVA